MNHKGFKQMARLLLVVLTVGLRAVSSNGEGAIEQLKALRVTLDESLGLYDTIDGSSPGSPAGVYVKSGELNDAPTFSREADDGEDMHMYRSSNGIWVMTNITANFESNRGSFITSKTGASPIGLGWR
jgi:hypothetical protein